MRYMKIQITAWRDRSAARTPTTVRQLFVLNERESAVRKAIAPVQSDRPADALSSPELAQISADRNAVLAAEETAARSAHAASSVHERVNTYGYQEISDDGSQVVALKDDVGNPFPEGAAFEYEIVDSNPLMPVWGMPVELLATLPTKV